jgi:mannose/cellobiose epimerase-like protein (N-acyl-D-glucosamine 2-epimerase family)
MAEIVADYKTHRAGEREVVDWKRPDGVLYRDVPVMYLREASLAEYRVNHPHAQLTPDRCHFWEVSVD